MHKLAISQSVIDRVVARRGREHIFDNLNPAKTALVVVDMQNGFMVPEVGHAPCKMAHEIVPNINRLADAVRATGGAVIWIQTAYSDETLTSWSTLYGMMLPKGRERRKFSLSPSNKGYEIFPDLKVEPQDLIVVKSRYSAFIQGSSNIEEVLRGRGLDTLLITGTVTNVCCESTARDAMMRNYKTIMVTEEGTKAVDSASGLVDKVQLSFASIMGSVQETSRTAKEITLSTQQQTSACEQMAQTMSGVRDVAQQVALYASETETAISEILELARRLKDITEKEA